MFGHIAQLPQKMTRSRRRRAGITLVFQPCISTLYFNLVFQTAATPIWAVLWFTESNDQTSTDPTVSVFYCGRGFLHCFLLL